MKSMDDDIDGIEMNDTWELVDLPLHKQCVGVKCIYKTKLNVDGEFEKHALGVFLKGLVNNLVFIIMKHFTMWQVRHNKEACVIHLSVVHMRCTLDPYIKYMFLNGFLEE